MADEGHDRTDKILEKLEKQIQKEYRQAAREVDKKAQAYFKQFKAKEADERKRLEAGEITQDQFDRWRVTQMLTGQRWEQMRDTLAADMVNANNIARSTMFDHMGDVYALNRNYAAYEIEADAKIDTSWTLYNNRSTEFLFTNKDNLLPPPKKGGKAWQAMQNKDTRWNQQKINSSLIQGILQGDSISEISDRLFSVVGMNANSAIRSARTMTTYVENRGRDDTYEELREQGIELDTVWVATLDDRTRSTHRWLHGEVRDESTGMYSNGLRFPADPRGDPEEVYNCRCCETSTVKGFPIDMPKWSPKMGDMTFEEWLGEHSPFDRSVNVSDVAPLATSSSEFFDRFKSIQGTDRKHQKGMAEKIAECDNTLVQNLYYKYADQLVAVNTRSRSKAYFSNDEGGITFGQRADERGDVCHRPFQTSFHEFGHMIDWLANGKTGHLYLSKTEVDGEFLIDKIQADYDAFKKSIGLEEGRDVRDYLRKMYWKSDGSHYYEFGNVSDILEYCTGCSHPLGVGHGVDYHLGAGRRALGMTEAEFFAEVLDSAVANPESYERMKEFFPSAVEWVWRALKGVV